MLRKPMASITPLPCAQHQWRACRLRGSKLGEKTSRPCGGVQCVVFRKVWEAEVEGCLVVRGAGREASTRGAREIHFELIDTVFQWTRIEGP